MLRPKTSSAHAWKFFRTGGLDQVSLETGADLLALGDLDQKLWVALACPVTGLELDEKTLALVDSDHDGRIRAPEVIAAVRWAAARLKDPGVLLRGDAELPLDAINDATPEGKVLLASARQILDRHGRKDATAISIADAADTATIYAASPLNGDGVIPPEAADDAAVKALIGDIITTIGGTADLNGSVGVTAEAIATFFAEVQAYLDWADLSTKPETAILGDQTAAAANAIEAVRAKVDDYFARCALAAFDPRAAATLNRSESDYQAIAAKNLGADAADASAFPLARIEAHRPLPLLDGVNPAWAAALATLHSVVVAPLFGPDKTALTADEWKSLTAKFAGFSAWLAAKAGRRVEPLGLDRLRALASGDERAALAALVAKDKAFAPEFQAIADVERLARYHRDLRTLLENFVNFRDFYSRDRLAVFQAGVLFLDSRSTELCLRVDAPTPLAAKSQACIAYCACTRGAEKMTLAACFTQGDSDYLFVGRHGVFYDRRGRDWDAVITALVDNPISIRQAFFSPYKKFVRFIEEQVAKRAAAADAESTTKLASAAEATATVDKTKPPATPKKIDIGTVAALGVAVGGITAAFGTIMGAFFGLGVWMPVGLIGILLAISGPSMLIAWLKLRQRTLGPILDSNGWAVNGRVKINFPLGTALTDVATLPPGARRTGEDPYVDTEARRQRRSVIIMILVVLLAGASIFVRWQRLKTGHYFWQPAPAAETPPPEAPPAPKS